MKTRKELNEIYNQYLLECIPDNERILNEYGVKTESDKDRIEFVVNCFNSEFNYENNKKRYPVLQTRLSEWFMGLPSAISIDFENYVILQLLTTWEVLPEYSTEKQQDKYLGNWFNYMAYRFIKLCEKNKINIFKLC